MALDLLGEWFSPVAVQAEQMRRSFALFVKAAWSQIDPAPLVWSMHLDALCTCLQAVSDRKISDLLINVPPGHGKSLVVSVLWPAWEWTRNPSWQLLTASYASVIVTRDAVKSRELMNSVWYTEYFRSGDDGWKWKEDMSVKTFYANTAGGHRQSLTVGGAGTGARGGCLLVDDPQSVGQSYSKAERENVKRWFTETMETRFNDMARRQRVCIMQRLHQDDLSSTMLAQGGWEHLNLPAEFDPRTRAVVKGKSGEVIWSDPREKEGDLLFPARFPTEVIEKTKRTLGSYAYAAQFQQNPSVADGAILKRAWLEKRWAIRTNSYVVEEGCAVLPHKLDAIEMFTDATFKKTSTSDYVSIQVWGRKGPNLFLIDHVWDRMGFVETMDAIKAMRAKHPGITSVCVEAAANGHAIIEVLKGEMPGIIAIKPTGSKEARVSAASKYFESGNIYLPRNAPWLTSYIEECANFPNAAHDDAVDATAHAINRMLVNSDLAWLTQMVEGA